MNLLRLRRTVFSVLTMQNYSFPLSLANVNMVILNILQFFETNFRLINNY